MLFGQAQVLVECGASIGHALRVVVPPERFQGDAGPSWLEFARSQDTLGVGGFGVNGGNIESVSRAVDDEELPPAPNPGAEWWTTSDVAAYLRVRVATVSTYRVRGQMPPPEQTVGRTHMWRPAAVIAWHETRPRPGVGGRVGDHDPKRSSGTL